MNMFNGYNQPPYESDQSRVNALKKSGSIPQWPYGEQYFNPDVQQQPASNTWAAPKPPYLGMGGKCACAECQQGSWYHKDQNEVITTPSGQELMVLGQNPNACGYPTESRYVGQEAYVRPGASMSISKSFQSCSYPSSINQSYPQKTTAVKHPSNPEYPSYERNSDQYLRMFEATSAYGRKQTEQRQNYWDGSNGPFYPNEMSRMQQYQQYQQPCRFPPYNPPYYFQGSPSVQSYQHPQQNGHPYYNKIQNQQRPVDPLPQPQPPYIKHDNSVATKISPLRLMRKKKLLGHMGQGSPPRPTNPVPENTPKLDVRRFLATWADEDEDTPPTPQVVVLDCQDINPEQAELLRWYEDQNTVRIIPETQVNPQVQQTQLPPQPSVPPQQPVQFESPQWQNQPQLPAQEQKEVPQSQRLMEPETPPPKAEMPVIAETFKVPESTKIAEDPPPPPVPPDPSPQKDENLALPVERLQENEIVESSSSSGSPSDSSDSLPLITDLPTSEYRKNKFLDYDQPSFPKLPPVAEVIASAVSQSEVPQVPAMTVVDSADKPKKKRNRKPTIKFSIQKSHDLKISLRVMNESERAEQQKKEICQEIRQGQSESCDRELITLSLEGMQDREEIQEDSSEGPLKKSRKVKRRYYQAQTYSVSTEDIACDDRADGFQVQESVDSAKIKLTFKRRRAEAISESHKRKADQEVQVRKKRKRRLKYSCDSNCADSSDGDALSADTTTDYNGLPPSTCPASPDGAILHDPLASEHPKRDDEDKKNTLVQFSPSYIDVSGRVIDYNAKRVKTWGADSSSMDSLKEKTVGALDNIVVNSGSAASVVVATENSPKRSARNSPRTSTDSIERELQAIWNGNTGDDELGDDYISRSNAVSEEVEDSTRHQTELLNEASSYNAVALPELNVSAPTSEHTSQLDHSSASEVAVSERCGVINFCRSGSVVSYSDREPLDLRSSFHSERSTFSGEIPFGDLADVADNSEPSSASLNVASCTTTENSLQHSTSPKPHLDDASQKNSPSPPTITLPDASAVTNDEINCNYNGFHSPEVSSNQLEIPSSSDVNAFLPSKETLGQNVGSPFDTLSLHLDDEVQEYPSEPITVEPEPTLKRSPQGNELDYTFGTGEKVKETNKLGVDLNTSKESHYKIDMKNNILATPEAPKFSDDTESVQSGTSCLKTPSPSRSCEYEEYVGCSVKEDNSKLLSDETNFQKIGQNESAPFREIIDLIGNMGDSLSSNSTSRGDSFSEVSEKSNNSLEEMHFTEVKAIVHSHETGISISDTANSPDSVNPENSLTSAQSSCYQSPNPVRLPSEASEDKSGNDKSNFTHTAVYSELENKLAHSAQRHKSKEKDIVFDSQGISCNEKLRNERYVSLHHTDHESSGDKLHLKAVTEVTSTLKGMLEVTGGSMLPIHSPLKQTALYTDSLAKHHSDLFENNKVTNSSGSFFDYHTSQSPTQSSEICFSPVLKLDSNESCTSEPEEIGQSTSRVENRVSVANNCGVTSPVKQITPLNKSPSTNERNSELKRTEPVTCKQERLCSEFPPMASPCKSLDVTAYVPRGPRTPKGPAPDSPYYISPASYNISDCSNSDDDSYNYKDYVVEDTPRQMSNKQDNKHDNTDLSNVKSSTPNRINSDIDVKLIDCQTANFVRDDRPYKNCEEVIHESPIIMEGRCRDDDSISSLELEADENDNLILADLPDREEDIAALESIQRDDDELTGQSDYQPMNDDDMLPADTTEISSDFIKPEGTSNFPYLGRELDPLEESLMNSPQTQPEIKNLVLQENRLNEQSICIDHPSKLKTQENQKLAHVQSEHSSLLEENKIDKIIETSICNTDAENILPVELTIHSSECTEEVAANSFELSDKLECKPFENEPEESNEIKDTSMSVISIDSSRMEEVMKIAITDQSNKLENTSNSPEGWEEVAVLEEGEIIDEDQEYIIVAECDDMAVADETEVIVIEPDDELNEEKTGDSSILTIDVANIPLPPGKAPKENCFDLIKWREAKELQIRPTSGTRRPPSCDSPFSLEKMELFRNPSPPRCEERPGTPDLATISEVDTSIAVDELLLNEPFTGDSEMKPATLIPSNDPFDPAVPSVDGDQVPNEDEFHDVMASCLENAKRFLDRGSVLVEGNESSKDVLLSSSGAQSDIELSGETLTSNVSLDCSVAWASDILPVDNWPYLEEEVPLSPSWKPANDVEAEELQAYVEIVSASTEPLEHPLLPRFLCTNKSRRALTDFFSLKKSKDDEKRKRRSTVDDVVRRVGRRSKKLSLTDNESSCSETSAETIENNLKCQLSLERLNLPKANLVDKCKMDPPLDPTSEKYKSPQWQPKVVLDIISSDVGLAHSLKRSQSAPLIVKHLHSDKETFQRKKSSEKKSRRLSFILKSSRYEKRQRKDSSTSSSSHESGLIPKSPKKPNIKKCSNSDGCDSLMLSSRPHASETRNNPSPSSEAIQYNAQYSSKGKIEPLPCNTLTSCVGTRQLPADNKKNENDKKSRKSGPDTAVAAAADEVVQKLVSNNGEDERANDKKIQKEISGSKPVVERESKRRTRKDSEVNRIGEMCEKQNNKIQHKKNNVEKKGVRIINEKHSFEAKEKSQESNPKGGKVRSADDDNQKHHKKRGKNEKSTDRKEETMKMGSKEGRMESGIDMLCKDQSIKREAKFVDLSKKGHETVDEPVKGALGTQKTLLGSNEHCESKSQKHHEKTEAYDEKVEECKIYSVGNENPNCQVKDRAKVRSKHCEKAELIVKKPFEDGSRTTRSSMTGKSEHQPSEINEELKMSSRKSQKESIKNSENDDPRTSKKPDSELVDSHRNDVPSIDIMKEDEAKCEKKLELQEEKIETDEIEKTRSNEKQVLDKKSVTSIIDREPPSSKEALPSKSRISVNEYTKRLKRNSQSNGVDVQQGSLETLLSTVSNENDEVVSKMEEVNTGADLCKQNSLTKESNPVIVSVDLTSEDEVEKCSGAIIPEQKWVCCVCGFNEETQRERHIQEHSFHCQSCHLAFLSEPHFIEHLNQSHQDIKKQHHCLLCEMSFPSDAEYRDHLKSREHQHLDAVEKNTIQTLFTMLSGEDCPVLGTVTPRPEWLPSQAGTVHFYHQATPLSLAIQYWKLKNGQSSVKP